MARALITGGRGFAAGYLAEHLAAGGREVLRSATSALTAGGDVVLDVTDAAQCRELVASVQPDEIYHLAGMSRPGSGQVGEFYAVNADGARNLLDAVAAEAPDCRVLIVGSAYAYGRQSRPIDERVALAPRNHYGASKAAADAVALAYAALGLHVVIARPFNHSGPGQPTDFLLPTLVEQFGEMLQGSRERVVQLGNLDSIRDFSDVRDIVRGYRLALASGAPGSIFNFGSGRGVSVRELLALVTAAAGIEAELQHEPARVRGDDLPELVCNPTKAREQLGWSCEIELEQTIADMLAHVAAPV